jgi:hypothetical protein
MNESFIHSRFQLTTTESRVSLLDVWPLSPLFVVGFAHQRSATLPKWQNTTTDRRTDVEPSETDREKQLTRVRKAEVRQASERAFSVQVQRVTKRPKNTLLYTSVKAWTSDN